MSAPTPTAPQLVDETSAGALRFSKWRLSNGLEIILAPDENARAVAYTTWFRVGSRHENEPQGETGLAHLFEHLMFTQTASAKADGDFDRQMEAAGGSSNAMTDVDFTAYVNVVPPGELALAASLEADRMQNLALKSEQIETERGVVMEERLSTVEDSVDGTLDEILSQAAYKSHPYRWPVIGHMEHIKKVPQEAIARFYRTHYNPNNAVVIVAGKFDSQAALSTIAKRYAQLPSTSIPVPAPVTEQAPVAAARKTIEWPVPADRLAVALGAPALGHPDRAAFEVMDAILSDGPGSRLHRTLVVQSEIASSVDCQVSPTRENGLYVVWVQMREGHKAAEAEAHINRIVNDLTNQPVSHAELDRAKNRLAMDFWLSLASSEGRAEQLGVFEIATGSYRNMLERDAQVQTVSAADVQRVARQYLLERPQVVAIATPKK